MRAASLGEYLQRWTRKDLSACRPARSHSASDRRRGDMRFHSAVFRGDAVSVFEEATPGRRGGEPGVAAVASAARLHRSGERASRENRRLSPPNCVTVAPSR